MKLALAIVLASLIFLPLAQGPASYSTSTPTYGTVTFSTSPQIFPDQGFIYNVTLVGWSDGNFSGTFWLGGYGLCGWATNIPASNTLNITVTCDTVGPAILSDQTVQLSFNADTHYYYGPYVLVQWPRVGGGGVPPRQA